MPHLPDSPRLRLDGGRVTLSATIGSPLGEFITALADTWQPPRLLARVEPVSRLEFTSVNLCRQAAHHCVMALWDALAKDGLMPLTRPTVGWYVVPEPHLATEPDAAPAPTDRDDRPRLRAAPGTHLPDRYTAECVAAVHAVPLPSARDPRGTASPPAGPPADRLAPPTVEP